MTWSNLPPSLNLSQPNSCPSCQLDLHLPKAGALDTHPLVSHIQSIRRPVLTSDLIHLTFHADTRPRQEGLSPRLWLSPPQGHGILFPTNGIEHCDDLGTKDADGFGSLYPPVCTYTQHPRRAHHGLLWGCAAVFWGSWARFASMRAW